MRHVTVFGQEGVYAGWPANHGSWQWGDELLFGFIRGKHNIGGMHNVRGRLEKVLARSLDGGETWSVEVPNVDFECEVPEAAPPMDLSRTIIRVCGNYDHGGEHCHDQGGFYSSTDRGKTWAGPFFFTGLPLPDKKLGTSRTCVLNNHLVFLSARTKHHWGSDFVYCATHDGTKFAGKSIVLDDEYRAVMPAAAVVGPGRIIVAMRRRGSKRLGGWVDSVFSDDGGQTWSEPLHVGETGKDNGNPPAVVEAGGNVYCAFANRSESTVDVMVTKDGGLSWAAHALLRKGSPSGPDIGYPRLFKRTDGQLVCVYYWTDGFEVPQRIEATIFAP